MLNKLRVIEKANLLCMLCLAISLPWAKSASTVPMIIWIIVGAVGFPFIYKRYKKLSVVYPFILLYFGFFINAIFHGMNHEAFIVLEKKSSLLYIPILVMLVPTINKSIVNKVEWAFIVSLLLYLFYSIIQVYQSFPHEFTKHIFYGDLLNATRMHTSYISIFCLISILLLFKKVSSNTLIQNVFYFGLMFIFTVFVWLLLARTQIIILLLLVSLLLLSNFIKSQNIIGLIFIILIPVASVLMIDKIPELKVRFQALYKAEGNVRDDRYDIWDASIQVIKANPILGHGIGQSENLLQSKFLENGKLKPIKKGINNAHNQYLQDWMELGMFGLVLLVFLLLYLCKMARNSIHPAIQISILTVFILSFFTECILESQPGVVCFTYFSSIMLRNGK